MKVCQYCRDEIHGGDGDNSCKACRTARTESERRRRARAQAKERDAIMKDLGLTKVKGAMGGIYYE